MDMFMGNKIILLLVIAIFVSCKQDSDCIAEENDTIYFEGFDSITKVSIEDLVNKTNNLEYINPEFETTKNNAKKLIINDPTTNLFKNGFKIIINDSINYKITDIKLGQLDIEKKTMWGTKLYQCGLKEYRINDSLINTYGMIIIEKLKD